MWHMKRISACWNSDCIEYKRRSFRKAVKIVRKRTIDIRIAIEVWWQRWESKQAARAPCRVRHVRPSHIHKCFEERWFYCTISLRILRWQKNENYLQSNRKFKFKSVKNKSVILRLQMQLSRSQIYGRNGILDFSLTLYWNSAIRLGRNSSSKKKELE